MLSANLRNGSNPSTALAEELVEPCVGEDELVVAEASRDVKGTSAPPRKSIVRRGIAALMSGFDWCFGGASMVLILAILATVPLLNLMSLGYLLEVGGRIARTGKFREGFIGFRAASRIGSLSLGAWLMFWPLRALSDAWQSARLIDPASPNTQVLWSVTVMATVLVGLHIAWAGYRGGRLWHFLWPQPIRFCRTIVQGGMYREAREGILKFLKGLRLWYYFSLGFRGFVGTLLWLAVPVLWLITVRQAPVPETAFVLSLPGMVLFAVVLVYLPFAQVQFAAENRFRAMFAWSTLRRKFRHAPMAFWLALLLTLSLAIPLYLLKIELIDRDLVWMLSLFFVVSTIPARMACGWAMARAELREQPVHWSLRWLCRFAAVPVTSTYVFFMYLSLYTSWRGAPSLLEQHAFLVPAPFFGS